MQRVRALAQELVEVEIWLVAVAAAVALVWAWAVPAALLVVALFWPLRWLAAGRPSVSTSVDWAVLLLLVCLPVTFWATPVPTVTLLQVGRLLIGVGLLYATVNWVQDLGRALLLAQAFVGLGGLLALLAPLTVRWKAVGKLPFLPAALYERFTLILGDSIHANVLAGALILLLPLAVGLLLWGWGRSGPAVRLYLLAVAGLMGAVLLLTQSRGALVALALALAVLVALRWRAGWIALLLLAAAVPIMLWVGDLDLILSQSSVSLGEAEYAIGTLAYRLDTWQRALAMVRDFPFTGAGMGAFEKVANLLYPSQQRITDVPHAHNLYLQIAADLGIPGLIGWLALLLLALAAAWQGYRRGWMQRNGRLAGLAAGLLGSQTAMLVHGLTDAVVWGMVRTAVLVWGLWGLMVALDRLQGRVALTEEG